MSTDNEYLRLIYNSLEAANPNNQSATAQPVIMVGTMTTPNESATLMLAGRSLVSIGFRISSINTSVGIGLRCLLYTGGFPLSADGNAVMTLTANGLYLYTWEGAADSIVIKFESESGGIDAEIHYTARAQ
jgi:hypothetical protein